MVAKIEDIEFLVVKNEVEALVLESNFYQAISAQNIMFCSATIKITPISK